MRVLKVMAGALPSKLGDDAPYIGMCYSGVIAIGRYILRKILTGQLYKEDYRDLRQNPSRSLNKIKLELRSAAVIISPQL